MNSSSELSSSSAQNKSIPPSEKQVQLSKPKVNNSDTQNQPNSERQQPIPPPSHPRQYRAIGLVRAKYEVSDSQLTQGTLVTTEGAKIDAVLLGRVISLVKNHLDLSQEHLWVVYPRTKPQNETLHLQIVGVWEPETLSQTEIPTEKIDEPENGYFSIRGEVVYYSQEKEVVVVKIKQFPRKEGDKIKFFKLQLKGSLPDKPLHHFWDLKINLSGQTLTIEEGTDLGALPVKKKFGPKKGKKKFSKKPSLSGSKSRSGSKPSPTPRPIAKPSKPKKPSSRSE